jgi:hypothetical protein
MHDPAVVALLMSLLGTLRSVFRTRAELALENLALRQQLANLRRTSARPRLRGIDRAFWLALSRLWSHDRRRVVHWNITSHPGAQWTAHPPTMGKVEALPQVGGLHHRYEPLAA